MFILSLASMYSSQASYLGIIGLIVLTLFYKTIVYPLFISPLRNIPGPKLAAITSLYLNSYYYTETGVPWIKSLHEKYGPIVRVGPNEVVIDDPEQLSAIYGVRSTLRKPPFTSLLDNYGFPNTFSSITREDHRNRRKLVSKVYTMSSNLNNVPLMSWVQNRLDKVMNKIESQAFKPVDIFSLSTHFALDNVSYMVYGESLDLLGGKNLRVAEDIRHTTISSVPFVRFHKLFSLMFSIWPLSFFIPEFIMKATIARESLESIVEGQIDHLNSSEKRPDPANTALGYLQSQPGFGKTYTEGHVKSECFDHILAGADSTAAGIIYLLYTLALPENRKYQEKLREEVSQLPSPLNFKEVCNLPYLNTCIIESLRLNPPGPGAMQQRTVSENDHLTLKIHEKSYTLPPNTVVGVQAYSLHHKESIFGPDSDQFRPERWESTDETQVQKMKDAWIAFGTGARICLGMNFAIIEMKVIITTILQKFTIEVPSYENPEDMLPIFAAVIRPRAERCDLLFKKISSSS